jgi:DNA-binding NtrC family response regulator
MIGSIAMSNLLRRDGPAILIVDDEACQRIAAAEMLNAAGFEALEACSAAEAVLTLESASNIRVLVTDIDLSAGINGIVLAACVDRRWPAVRIIMTSGKVKPLPGDVPSRARFLPKPYAEARMLAAVREMIGQRAI